MGTFFGSPYSKGEQSTDHDKKQPQGANSGTPNATIHEPTHTAKSWVEPFRNTVMVCTCVFVVVLLLVDYFGGKIYGALAVVAICLTTLMSLYITWTAARMFETMIENDKLPQFVIGYIALLATSPLTNVLLIEYVKTNIPL